MPVSHTPNLILITTDEQRGDCLGCDGHPALETPYLDELASRGCRFAHAYTAVPSCTPARAAMLTGMDQWQHGRLTMTGSDYLAYPATLPAELARAGYHTQAVGKMHFAPQRSLYGFHNTVLDESGRRQGDFYSDYHRWFDDHIDGPYGYRDHSVDWNSWMARPTHLPEHLHPSHWTASRAIDFLKTRDPMRPFFLWLSFARPHAPFDAPQTYFDMYRHHPELPEPAVGDWAEPFARRNDDVNAPRSRRTPREIRRAQAGYYGNITFIDHQIGRVLYELRRHQRETYRNTLIVFTSDHGNMMGDHHHWRKTYAFEGSARIPLLVAYPSAWELPRGQVYDAPVELRDIMPTLLDAAGVEQPPTVDGESLLALPRGDDQGWRPFVQGEHTLCYGREWGMQYVTDGREKYIWYHHTGREQFFDLEVDPRETRDLAQAADDAAEQRIQRWRRRLAQINEDRGDPRGQDGRLVTQPDGALRLSPNYQRWRQRADQGFHPGEP